MSIEKFVIKNNIIETAQQLCSVIPDISERGRASANIIASECVSEYFEELGVEIDTNSGLHNVPKILEDIEISDVYLNNAYIDVRLCTSIRDLSVPAAHFRNDVIPSAYMFIKLDEDLSSYEVLGFVLPEGIEQDNEIDGYYMVDSELLLSFNEVSEYIEAKPIEEINNADIFKYLEDSLENKSEFIKKLLGSKPARQKLIQCYKAQSVFNYISENDNEASFEEYVAESEDSNTSFEYTTVATPSLDLSYQEETQDENKDETSFEEANELEFKKDIDNFINTEVNQNNEEIPDTNNNEIVDDLFVQNQVSEDDSEPFTDGDFDINAIRAKQNKKPMLVLIISVIGVILAGVGGYLLFANSHNSKSDALLPPPSINQDITQEPNENSSGEPSAEETAMPVETVEKPAENNNNNEGNAISVPEIERSLDASVLVSNLKIDWEVPIGYASNTSATRYFIKLGKIIQLNLKTEMLLLNKPPLSNKIAVEIKYDKSAKAFDTVGINISSGEKTIDDLVLQTVKKALKMKLSTSLDSFGNISGNPVLIIRL